MKNINSMLGFFGSLKGQLLNAVWDLPNYNQRLSNSILMKINITSVMLFVLMMQVSAHSKAQRISMTEKNLSLSSLLNKIGKQTGYDFIYTNEMLQDKEMISISVKDKELGALLDDLFEDKNLKYTIRSKTIVIQRAIKEGKPMLEQERIPVKGVVFDKNKQPIAGVSVSEKGSPNGLLTAADGSFALIVEKGATLVFSHVSFERQEVKLKAGQGSIQVSLVEQLASLEEIEVVNTGYQRIAKDQLTGAASTVNEQQYQQRVAVTGNFLESLEGKVPGLVYNAQSGELSIRGISTFDAVKQPLIVLDGFPTEIDLRTINPNDIVSVSVLRDAAAAAIYGVRASNGVIVVETRRGKSGKTVFTARSTFAFQNKPDFSYLNYAPAAEFIQLQKDLFDIGKTSFSLYEMGIYKMNPVEEILFGKTQLSVSNPLLTEEQANAKLAALGSLDNLKQYEDLFYQKRLAQNYNFDLSGGSDKSTYMLGLNYIHEQPVTRRSDNKQFLLNFANTYRLSERFNVDFKGNYSRQKDVSGETPNYVNFFPYERLVDDQGKALPVTFTPTRSNFERIITEEGNQAWMNAGLPDQRYYPYKELLHNNNSLNTNALRLQARVNAKLTDWLNLDLGGNYEQQNGVLDKLQGIETFNTSYLVAGSATKAVGSGKAVFKNMPYGDILSRTHQELTNYTLRGQLNFAKKFVDNRHDISGIVGFEQKRLFRKSALNTSFGYDGQTLISKPANLDLLNEISFPDFDDLTSYFSFRSTDFFKETEDDRRFVSYYGQGTYIFDGKYIATGSFRIDQSNLFGVNPKYKNKPLWSAGVNWRADREGFVQEIDWINQLQVRAATGFNGNVPMSNSGAFLVLQSGLNAALSPAQTFNTILSPENQSIRWETTRNYNVGLDYGLFNGRVSGTIDWYLKKSFDVFGRFDADPTSGFNDYDANTASIENRGFEFLVNTQNIKASNWGWNTQLTASFNRNNILAVKETQLANSQLYTSGQNRIKGQPIGALYSYNYGGLNSMGQPFVLDRYGKENVLAFYGGAQVDVQLDDLIFNGTVTPKHVLGLNNQFRYKDFDLSFLFMYYGGHVMRVQQANPMDIEGYSINPLKGSSDFWRKAGDEQTTRVPGFVRASSLAPGYYQSYARYGYEYAAEFVRKADHIRLRDVVLSYNPRAAFLTNMGLRNPQIRFQAQNVFKYTFSGNDIDPDAIDRISGARKLENQPFYSLTLSTNF